MAKNICQGCIHWDGPRWGCELGPSALSACAQAEEEEAEVNSLVWSDEDIDYIMPANEDESWLEERLYIEEG